MLPGIKKSFLFSVFLYAFSLPISITLTNISLFFLLLSSISLGIQNKEFPKIPCSFTMLAIFFLWAMVTITFSRGNLLFSDFAAFRKLWNLFPYILIPALTLLTAGGEALSCFSTNKIYSILKVLAMTGSSVAILGMLELLFGVRYFFSGWFGFEQFFLENRFNGFQSHPLHAGGLYTLLFLCALSIALFHARYSSGAILDSANSKISAKEKYLWLFCAILLGCGVFLTGSRSYYLALSFGLLLLLASRGWKFFFAGSTVALTLLLALSFFNPYVAERIKTILPSQTDESGRQRIFMWKSALSMIAEHPLTGVGYKRWREELPDYAERFPDWKMENAALSHAHNSYLTVAAETGIVGLCLFLFFWVWLIREQVGFLRGSEKGTLGYALAMGCLASIAALLCAGFFEHNLLTAVNSLALFFLIGLSRAAAGASS